MKHLTVLHCIARMADGGAERQLAYLSRQLVNKGLSVHVFLLYNDGSNFQRLKNSGAIIHKVSVKGNYSVKIILGLLKVVRRVRPQIIQTWLPQMDIVGGIVAMILRIPFIISERSSEMAYPAHWKNSLRIFIGKRAAAVVSNSKGGQCYWDKISGSVSTNLVIENGLPLKEIEECRFDPDEVYWLESADELILFAGRYVGYKNVINLSHAVHKVLASRSQAKAVFFGDGPLKPELVAMNNDKNADGRVKIMDYTPNLWGWLKRANVFLSVGTFEGRPNTVLEAIACKTPLVVSDIPAHREILDNDSAIFVPADSIEAIAKAIEDVLTRSPDERNKVAAHYDSMQLPSNEDCADKFIQLYRNIEEYKEISTQEHS